MNNNVKIVTLAKYMTFGAVIYLLFILQEVPGLLVFWGVKPMLIMPACLCIAIHEGEFAGGVIGALGGMLCDLGYSGVFGFNSILLLVGCVATGLIIIYLMKNSLVNAMLITGVFLILRALLEYFFMFYMWGYDNVRLLLLNQMVPTALLSVLWVIPMYYLFSKLHAYFLSLLTI